MTSPTSDADLFAAVTALDLDLSRRAEALWSRLDPVDLQGSFVADVLPELAAQTTQVQAAAADIGAGFTSRAVVTAELPPPPLVIAESFAGVAADGGPLRGLLSQPLVSTYTALARGLEMPAALASGFDSMDQILATTVQDASRAASSVVVAATREITFYVRAVEPGACGRCIVLAGRRYKWSQGFLRHPKCRCHMAPETVVDESAIPSPKETFAAMSPAEQDAAFGQANARAIREGGDIYRVVNATARSSGMTTPLDQRRRRPAGSKMTPQQIYTLAGDDRDLAVQLLRRYGFIR